MTQQIDPLHSLVQSMGGLKTSTSPPVNAPHHHQGSNIIRPSSVQPEKNPISDLLRQLGAPQDKPLKVIFYFIIFIFMYKHLYMCRRSDFVHI